MEPEHNLAGCCLKRPTLGPGVPQAAQSPLIERGSEGRAVGPSRVVRQSLAGSKALGLTIANIRLGRLHILARRRLGPSSGYPNRVTVQAGCSVFTQEFLDHALGLLIFAFAEVVITDSPSPIDEVVSRPVSVAECRPDRMIAVYRDGEGDSQVRDGVFHVRRIFLEAELRRMDANDDQAGILVL